MFKISVINDSIAKVFKEIEAEGLVLSDGERVDVSYDVSSYPASGIGAQKHTLRFNARFTSEKCSSEKKIVAVPVKYRAKFSIGDIVDDAIVVVKTELDEVPIHFKKPKPLTYTIPVDGEKALRADIHAYAKRLVK